MNNVTDRNRFTVKRALGVRHSEAEDRSAFFFSGYAFSCDNQIHTLSHRHYCLYHWKHAPGFVDIADHLAIQLDH